MMIAGLTEALKQTVIKALHVAAQILFFG